MHGCDISHVLVSHPGMWQWVDAIWAKVPETAVLTEQRLHALRGQRVMEAILLRRQLSSKQGFVDYCSEHGIQIEFARDLYERGVGMHQELFLPDQIGELQNKFLDDESTTVFLISTPVDQVDLMVSHAHEAPDRWAE